MSQGLGAAGNFRIPPPLMSLDDGDIIIEMAEGDDPGMKFDDDGKLIEIHHSDGSVTIDMDGKGLGEPDEPESPPGWFDNLAERIEGNELSRICEDLLRGIDADIESRKDWIEARANGIKLLGLTIELPNVSGGSDSAPLEGMSRVRNPLLLDACLFFQANARSELLPTDGPVKVRNDDAHADLPEDQLADAMQMDFNHYLTVTASEYYPDTDRMLLLTGFGGTGFKKVYKCPIRNRPVSESVDAPDLIVNNAATDLKNAQRVTHKILMRPSTVKRMQILGAYRDVDLSDPLQPTLNSYEMSKRAQEGVTDSSYRPEDRDREIYECYCELNVQGYEHVYKGKKSGLEIPYRVTIDVSSRQILSLVRNYNKPDKDKLPDARTTFIKYPFIPGFGFYDIGLLHILGNTTNALTAGWREAMDSGMFANFPGFLIAKVATRQNTNLLRVAPGTGVQVDTGAMSLKDAVMPLPYRDITPGFAALLDKIEQTGRRLGGTSEMQVGEGRPDAPVGTTLALIEQATKVMDNVHKRLHAAQAQELQLIAQVFKENPETFWQWGCRSGTAWTEQSFLTALNNCNLVPQADPNTASHAHRIMKIEALTRMAQQQPTLFDPIAIATAAIRALGFNNPEQFLAPPEAAAQPPPELVEMQGKLANQGKESDAKMLTAQAKMAEVQETAKAGGYGQPPQQAEGPDQPDQLDMMKAQADMMDAQTRAKEAATKAKEAEMENENRDKDRVSHEKIAAFGLAADMAKVKADQIQATEDRVADVEKDAEKGVGGDE